MATCPYCGKGAGLFARYHEACFQEAEKNRNIATQKVRDGILSAAKLSQPCFEVKQEIDQLAARYGLAQGAVSGVALSAVDELSREEPLAKAKYEYLQQLCQQVVGKPEDLPIGPFLYSYNRVLLNCGLSFALWCVMHCQNLSLSTPGDVVLQPSERRIWEFGTVVHRKSVTVSGHSGGYNGMSVRLASGLYYRFGGYGGYTAPQQVQNIDNGFLVVTNQALIFGGQQKTFRVPYTSIIRFSPHPDGLGFFRNIGDGREELFSVVDPYATLGLQPFSPIPPGTRYDVNKGVACPVGWFLYNVVTFLTTRPG